MAIWFTGLLVLAVVVFFLSRPRSGGPTGPTRWVVSAREPMNATERKFFRRLEETFPDLTILSQVALSQLVAVTNGKDYLRQRGKIDRKVVDFLVCDADMKVLVCIEIDGPAHGGRRQKRRDQDKSGALRAAGYRLLRFPTDHLPSASELKAAVFETVVTDTPAPSPAPGRLEPTLAPSTSGIQQELNV